MTATQNDTIQQWQEQFIASDWFVGRDGKIRLNYFKARAQYHGITSRMARTKGYQQYYHEAAAQGSEMIASAVVKATELLLSMGISLGDRALDDESTKVFLTRCNSLFRTLASPRHQYQFNVNSPFDTIRAEVEALYQLYYGDASPPSPASQPKVIKEDRGKYNRYITVPEDYISDPFIANLFNRIENGNENFFITGKAGTGKSTFLHFLAQNSRKKIVVAAYTGIAAINVGGTTLHSLFMLPFRPLLPRDEEIKRMNKWSPRRAILANMDMLVIDEVSMVRADVLEAIDHSLRINGGDPFKPFGGKQVLLIGDVFQLPPVVKTDDATEYQIFEEVYKTPYFFSAPSFKLTRFEFIEFTKIHRQSDDDFKSILNRIRIGNIEEEDLKPLNKRVYPNYEPRDQDFVLTLVTTNKLAGEINDRKLRDIIAPDYTYKANISNDYSKDKFPTDETLKLKVGAQIIFIRNDTTSEKTAKDNKRRWVNGTIAKVHALQDDEIEVMMEDGTINKVTRETWNNTVYKWDRMERKIKSETVGTFEQFPLKLAWAITIHKSQGLTFDKVVLNMGGGAFAHGQTYVALSRCKSLAGIALKKPITKRDIIIDDRVLDFYNRHFTFNDEYRENQEHIAFILEHSMFFIDLLSVHYPFASAQWERYKSVLNPNLLAHRPDKDKKVYDKLSFGEIKELLDAPNIIYNQSFWSNNFEYFFSENIVETILDYLLEIDKVIKVEESDEVGE